MCGDCNAFVAWLAIVVGVVVIGRASSFASLTVARRAASFVACMPMPSLMPSTPSIADAPFAEPSVAPLVASSLETSSSAHSVLVCLAPTVDVVSKLSQRRRCALVSSCSVLVAVECLLPTESRALEERSTR